MAEGVVSDDRFYCDLLKIGCSNTENLKIKIVVQDLLKINIKACTKSKIFLMCKTMIFYLVPIIFH